jgi:hypothetical protein
VGAVKTMTKDPRDRYQTYIWTVRENPLARLVKLADNWVNLTGLDGIEDEATRDRLRVKYVMARQHLEFK